MTIEERALGVAGNYFGMLPSVPMRQELVKELAAAINDAVREALEEAADKLEENEHLEGCTESCCIDGCLVNDPAGFLRARAGEPCQER